MGLNGPFLGLKSTNLFLTFFWNGTWWNILENVSKWQFLIFKENSQYAQYEKIRSYLGPNATPFNLFVKFFWNCTWWQTLKSGFNWLLQIFKGNFYYAQNWSFLGPKSALLKFPNLFFRFFQNFTWWRQKLVLGDWFVFWRKIFITPKMHFWAQNQHFWTFLVFLLLTLNIFHTFF